jgi:hypothetical protein
MDGWGREIKGTEEEMGGERENGKRGRSRRRRTRRQRKVEKGHAADGSSLQMKVVVTG